MNGVIKKARLKRLKRLLRFRRLLDAIAQERPAAGIR